MPWYIVLWLAWTAFGAAATINSIGKERKPITSTTATLAVVIFALQAWALVAVSS